MSPKNSSSDTLTATSSGSDVAVVICNGPSLASVPNEWLDKYPTFGANRIFLKYSPDVLTILDLKMVHNSKLQEEAREGAKGSKEVFQGNLTASFSANPPESVLVSGGTVTYGMFQLAYWKGFRKILTVGLNHTFRDPRGDHFSSDYNREVSIPYDRENVVDGEVASEPGKWFWSEEAFVAKTDFFYGVAKELFEREGGWIKNCTPDTKCTVFDVEDWRDY
jgi:hypothetical protein